MNSYSTLIPQLSNLSSIYVYFYLYISRELT